MSDWVRERILMEMTKQLTDEGRLIEAGWVQLQRMALPPDAPPVQIREMRNAYMAGAQHLWASLFTLLDPEVEPSEDDVRRVGLIAEELRVWAEEVKAAAERGHW
jgi:hypothetical protein